MWRFASDAIALAAIIILGLAVLISTPSWGASLPPYTPGGAPCNGVCQQEWAAEQANAPIQQPRPLLVPAGSVVVGMSYGKDGSPHWTSNPAVLTTDEPAQGYWFEHNDQAYLFARLEECKNWAVFMELQGEYLTQLTATSAPTHTHTSISPRYPSWPVIIHTTINPPSANPNPPTTPNPEPPETIPPVQLFASMWWLVMGLLGLSLWRVFQLRRKTMTFAK